MKHRDKLVPMVVALPLFLQNVDSSIMGTALPTIAASLHVETLRLNLAITAYLISLAIFLPASGWIADRFGPRRVFCAAIAVFAFGSGLSGASVSLEMLVACRVLQGLGGAMMIPVGRLILLRSVTPAAIVTAMVWFTVPPAFGRMIGPLVGGLTVTWFSWRWIFLVNVPLGLIGILLALAVLEPGEAPTDRRPFDAAGFFLLGVGLAALLGALETRGSKLMSPAASWVLAACGAASLAVYLLHSRRSAAPLIDLRIMRHPTFHASIIGGIPLRLAIGAMPFLLPLLLQLGFGMSPLDSGLLMMGTAIGSLGTRVVITSVLRVTGFRPLLLASTVCASASFVAYASLRGSTPHALVFAALLAGGLVMSLVMLTLQTLAFTEIPKALMGHATALSSMAQQLSFSVGVMLAVELLRAAVWWRQGQPGQLTAGDFPFVFLSIAGIVLVANVFFVRLQHDVGAQFRSS